MIGKCVLVGHGGTHFCQSQLTIWQVVTQSCVQLCGTNIILSSLKRVEFLQKRNVLKNKCVLPCWFFPPKNNNKKKNFKNLFSLPLKNYKKKIFKKNLLKKKGFYHIKIKKKKFFSREIVSKIFFLFF